MGDPDQLPPVEAGSFFTDFVAYCQEEKGPLARLEQCLRIDLQPIVDFAKLVKEGESAKALSMLQGGGASAFSWTHSLFDEKAMAQEIVERYSRQLLYLGDDPLQALQQQGKHRLLSALRQGPLGVDTLNEALWRAYFLQKRLGPFIVPIMVTSNHSGLGLYNGDIGVLQLPAATFSSSCLRRSGNTAYFLERKLGKLQKIPLALMPPFELAWCLSVHKSQGSEFDEVWLALPQSSTQFGKELLYTAVTRCRRALHLFGQPSTLSQVIASSAQRLSGLKEALKG
jgi:exodeoxyribonuclease V alpha subunit